MMDDQGQFRPHWQVATPTTEQLSDGIRAMQEFMARIQHTDHIKDKVCLACFNRRLTGAPWTFKPGERYIKVGRYVGQRPRRHTDYRAGVRA